MKNIKLIAMDVDGVLTDGSIIYGAGDIEIKVFYVRDGQGITLASRARIEIAFITARISEALVKRAKDLGVIEVHQGVDDKWDCLQKIMKRYQLKSEEVLYIGDDLIDIPVMKNVGYPVAVADAIDEVKEIAKYVTKKPGGKGAVREVINMVLKSKDKYNNLIKK
ncbi:HAD hydrolase family protein [candidate division WOR-3 bacterium]|nr:HAD hydrolase family protein [candidate division WOR-3 bacterium]